MIKTIKTITICLCFSFFACKQSTKTSVMPNDDVAATSAKKIEIAGLNFVAPPSDFPQNPMPAVQAVNANWIAVIPYGYTMPNVASVRYNEAKWQWFGETTAGIRKTIALARAANIKVMLKPQVYCPNSWTGYLDYDTEEKWQSWEKDYSKYLMLFVAIANDLDVEMICIGTEFNISAVKREPYWRKLIASIRTTYKGKLTYASNWDDYANIPFWDALDYAGVNAYFPLVDEKTPSVATLKNAWTKPMLDLEKFYQKTKKPIIFTEYGYLSVDNCAYKGWELEGKINDLSINEQAQSNAIEAILTTASQKEWFTGAFLWKWFPNMQGHEGYPDKDYTPQGKTAEKTLTKLYAR